MTIHRSFRSANSLQKHRNVLTRMERIAKLEALRKWEGEKDSVFKLPKIRNIKVRGKKKASADDEETGDAAAEQ